MRQDKNIFNKLRKSDQKKVRRVIKTDDKVKEVQRVIGKVKSVEKKVCETLYIKDGLAVDLKNFTVMSIPLNK